MKNKPSVLFLFGPTAVGKTECLRELFLNNAEIINADSMQVYCGMNIGTAKPDADFLSLIPHHLIDIRQPNQQFHAGDFVNEAQRLVEEIRERGVLPVVCGGTAFYFLNLLYGLPEVPPTNREVAAAIEAEIVNGGRERLYEELKRVDPLSAHRIPIGDTYRLTRALEVYRTQKRPLSSYKVNQTPREDWDIKVMALARPREELYRRIDQRVEMMFQQGLYEEWKSLCALGFQENDPGMKAIGYGEFFKFQDLDEVKRAIQKNSRHYAKRQITFFQKIPNQHHFLPQETKAMREFIFS